MRLLGVELRRAFARRLVRALIVLIVINFIVAGLIVFFRTDSDASAARKEAAIASLKQECLDGRLFAPGTPIPRYFGPRFEPGFAPDDSYPAPEVGTGEREAVCDFLSSQQMASTRIRRFNLAQISDVTESMVSLFTLLAVLIGASLIGAEWASKTIATHLTWEPRRIRTYLAKAAAAGIVAAVLFLFIQALEFLTLYPSALLHGTTEVHPGFWGDLFGLIGRSTAGTVMAAVLGFAIASVTQSTVFALGFTFLVSILDGLLGVIWRGYQSWSLFRNIAGYVSAQGVQEFSVDGQMYPGRSPGGSGFVLLGYAIVLLFIGANTFRRRDVT